MKHPALTRVFAVVLAVLCLVMLIAGAWGISKAAAEQLNSQANYQRLTGRIEEYRLVSQALEGTISYQEVSEQLDARQEKHDEDASQHRTDLATYTATKSGIQQGTQALDEADAAFAAGKAQYEQALAEFQKQEAAFNEGYQQFQRGRQQLADFQNTYNSAAGALASARSNLSALQNIGSIMDSEDENARQSLTVAAYDQALAAIDQAMGMVGDLQSMEPTLASLAAMSPEQLAQFAQGVGGGDAISAEQLGQIKAAYDANWQSVLGMIQNLNAQIPAIEAATGMTLSQLRQGIQAERDTIAGMDAETPISEEQFAAIKAVYEANRGAIAQAMAEADGQLSQLESSAAAVGAQLASAQAEMDSLAGTMEQGRAGIEQGRQALQEAGQQIEAGGAALYYSRTQIWYQLGELEKQKAKLEEEKQALEQDAGELDAIKQEAQQQKELEQRQTSLRLTLLDRDGIKDRVDQGAELLDAAQAYAAWYQADADHNYHGRLTAYILMVVGAMAGFLGIPGGFEKVRSRGRTIAPVALCLLCAVAAEAVCLYLGRGSTYSALAVAIFAAIQLVLVNLRAKA